MRVSSLVPVALAALAATTLLPPAAAQVIHLELGDDGTPGAGGPGCSDIADCWTYCMGPPPSTNPLLYVQCTLWVFWPTHSWAVCTLTTPFDWCGIPGVPSDG